MAGLIATATAQANGDGALSPTFTQQALRLYETIISGEHNRLKLSEAAIQRLKALQSELIYPQGETVASDGQPKTASGGSASANVAVGLPGLQTQKPTAYAPLPLYDVPKNQSYSGLDPIFLEKSDSLVRAELQLKRQRIERELLQQVDNSGHVARDRDQHGDGPHILDVDTILAASSALEPHVSGLKTVRSSRGDDTSFDENDYYSSRDQSAWSSPTNDVKQLGGVAVDLTGADTLSLGQHAGNAAPIVAIPDPAHKRAKRDTSVEDGEVDDDDADDDDEYSPPEAEDVVLSGGGANYTSAQQILMDEDGADDDDSEYEPIEIVQSNAARFGQSDNYPGTQVQVVKNHLTHIAAPQPNRVSPLAVAKGPSIELELVNGRPEVVRRPRQDDYGRAALSSASPPVGGIGGSGKKKRLKKRKREPEPPPLRNKKKRDRTGVATATRSGHEPRIKDEPVSPPPFDGISSSERISDGNISRHRTSNMPSAASPTTYRPVQRDTQDLRRIASLQYAQRPLSPSVQASNLPDQHRTVSMAYGEPIANTRSALPAYVQPAPRPLEPSNAEIRYVHLDRQYTPSRNGDPYLARVHSPAPNSAAPVPADRVVTDMHGNRYILAEPAPNTAAPAMYSDISRASVAPQDRHASHSVIYERAPSHAVAPFHQADVAPRYENMDLRMAPPPIPTAYRPAWADSQQVQYIPADPYQPRPPETVRYVEVPGAQFYPAYAQPEQPPQQQPPQHMPAPMTYLPRQTSVAPVQYMQHDMMAHAARASSVMPQYQRAGTVHPVQYTQSISSGTQPSVQYANAYGQPAPNPETRSASTYIYR